MNACLFKGKIKKAWLRGKMILNEFFAKCKYYSIRYAIYSSAWWIGWYFRNFKSLLNWGFREKTKWIDCYVKNKYGFILEKYRTMHQSNQHCEEYPIWVFWYQGVEQMPKLVKACYTQLQKNNPNEVKLVHSKNIGSYIDIPDYIFSKLDKGIITYTHFSDIVRVSLLVKYGGLWVDATCWTNAKIPQKIGEMILYSSKTNGISNLPLWSNSRWCGWGIGTCVKKNVLFLFIRDFLYEYWKTEDFLIDYLVIDFLIDLAYREIPSIKQEIDALPENNIGRNDLWFLMNKPFDENKYKELISDNWLFKLSYKSVLLKKTVTGESTFYGKLVGGEL